MIADNIENWRLIDGYDNYEVSSHGFVRNNKTGRILKHGINDGGYRHVMLRKNNKSKPYTIHKLVASRFCDNPNNYRCVDHIDNNRSNNHFNNLRWASHSMNSRNTKINKNNTSGVQGVVYINSKSLWRARITDNNNNRIDKKFSISVHGNDAKAKAIEWRRQKEHEYGYL